MRARWRLWSDTKGLHDPPRPVERLPRDAEVSPCGGWATVYAPDGRPVAVYMAEVKTTAKRVAGIFEPGWKGRL